MPYYPSIYAYLKRGFFWNYLVSTEKMPEISEENEFGMKPIVLRTDGTPDFRITYKKNRINIDCSHSLGDGKGIIIYFKALLARYNELRKGERRGTMQPVKTPLLTSGIPSAIIIGRAKKRQQTRAKRHFIFPRNMKRV